jgi:hypothetical protein
MRLFVAIVLPLAGLLLSGCDQLGIETPAQQLARADAEGKAVGSGCRQSGRALEDCYQISPKASKSAIFNGWRDMDAYMRENKIEVIPPQFPMTPPALKKKAGSPTAEAAPAAAEGKTAEAAGEAKPAAEKAAH